MTDIAPRFSVQRAVLALLDRDYPPLIGRPARVGGNLPREVDGLYVRIGRITGPGAGRIQFDTVLDIETFAPTYTAADSAAFAIEALLLGYPHSVVLDGRTVVIDRVDQNTSPQELPWDDVRVTRIGSTYSFTARRA